MWFLLLIRYRIFIVRWYWTRRIFVVIMVLYRRSKKLSWKIFISKMSQINSKIKSCISFVPQSIWFSHLLLKPWWFLWLLIVWFMPLWAAAAFLRKSRNVFVWLFCGDNMWWVVKKSPSASLEGLLSLVKLLLANPPPPPLLLWLLFVFGWLLLLLIKSFKCCCCWICCRKLCSMSLWRKNLTVSWLIKFDPKFSLESDVEFSGGGRGGGGGGGEGLFSLIGTCCCCWFRLLVRRRVAAAFAAAWTLVDAVWLMSGVNCWKNGDIVSKYRLVNFIYLSRCVFAIDPSPPLPLIELLLVCCCWWCCCCCWRRKYCCWSSKFGFFSLLCQSKFVTSFIKLLSAVDGRMNESNDVDVPSPSICEGDEDVVPFVEVVDLVAIFLSQLFSFTTSLTVVGRQISS